MITMRQIKIIKNCLLFIVLTLSLSGCGSQKNTAPPPLQVDTVKIKPQTVPINLQYVGMIKAVLSVDIRARVKGFLVERFFTEGDMVKKGDLLYVIDKRPFEVKLAIAKAQYLEAKAKAAYNLVEESRYADLVKRAVVSKEKYDEVKAQAQISIASVAVDKANIADAELNLSYATMYAPINGKIGETFVDVGNLVGTSGDTKLATIVQLNPIYVEFNASSKDLPMILRYQRNKGKLTVSVAVPAGNKVETYHGVLNFVNNEVEQTTSTILLRATVKNPDYGLLPNLPVKVTLHLTHQPNTILVPTKAITAEQGYHYVYLLSNNDTAVHQDITIAGQYKGQTIVKSGLKAGDVVIVNGLQYLKSGEKVQPSMLSLQQVLANQTGESVSHSNENRQKNANTKQKNANQTKQRHTATTQSSTTKSQPTDNRKKAN